MTTLKLTTVSKAHLVKVVSAYEAQRSHRVRDYTSREGKHYMERPTRKFAVVELPLGEYEVVDVTSHAVESGSDYCWVSYYTHAIIKSKKGSDRLYKVLIHTGGDSTPETFGEIVEESTLAIRPAGPMLGA